MGHRRFLAFVFGLVAVLVALIVTLPWWLAPVLTRVGSSYGATFGTYERIGYTRFALRDVEVQHPGVRVTVSDVKADTPVVWLWHRWTGRPTEIIAGTWTVAVKHPAVDPLESFVPPPASVGQAPTGPAGGQVAPAAGGWMPLRDRLQRIATALDHWVPRARIGPGRVSWLASGLTVTAATWQDRTLEVETLQLGPWQVRGTLAFPADDGLRLALQTTDTKDSAVLESRAKQVSGLLTWWGQPATLQANFGAVGWLPEAASLQADSWTVPGARLKLGERYATVQGQGKIEWRENHFVADVTVAGTPLADQSAPPLAATLRGHGDAQSFTIEELHAVLPGITAQLSEPVTVDRQGNFQQGAARFSAQVDLARQPWFDAQGTVSGEARLVAGVAQLPVVEFDLAAKAVTAGAFTLSAAEAHGRLIWPRLDVTTATMTLSPDETLTGQGGWDFHTQEVLAAAFTGKIHRATLARWLPAQPEFDFIALEAQASGPIANLAHAGTVRVESLTWPRLKPLAVAAAWRGQGRTLDDFTVEAKAGETTIAAAGAATGQGMHLTELSVVRGAATRLQLTAPAIVTWSPGLQIDGLHLDGEGDASVAVMLGDPGHLELTLHRASSAWLDDLISLPGPDWQVNSFDFAGRWDHGPMTYTVKADVAVELGDDRIASLALTAQGDKDGLQVEQLRASEGPEKILQATGQAPIILTPGRAKYWSIEPDGALAIKAHSQPNATFWTRLGELTGVAFTAPQATAHVTGTWTQPQGKIQLQAARIMIDPDRFKRPLPVLDALDVTLSGDNSGLKLDQLAVSIEGQAVRAEGRLLVTKGAWHELVTDPLGVAKRSAELHLEVPDADLAAWVRMLPPWMAPKGRLQVDLNYQGGGPVQGFLRLHNAATRPLGPIGVLQEINADVTLTGRSAALTQMTAKAGGRTVTVSGTIDFPAAETPRYAVALHGTNLPFVRQSGMLVRGDLDLTLRTPTAGPPVIGGTIRLRNSLFLSDVRSFLPGGTKGGTRTPPYFAVEMIPLNTWKFEVSVTGEQFLRLRTPVFNGVATARFQLGGTLGEPRAIGEMTINQGQVLMPFATFTVKQGSARITELNPHELKIFLRATGRRYDYELTMEVTGTPEAPSVVFTSSPALNSEQLLLMVMTGVAPTNEYAVSSTQRFARLGTYFGQSLLTSIGGDATSADRLSIRTGENITRQGRESYEVEYKLAERWKLFGEYDEFDDYNVGLKWRLYPGKRPTEAPRDETK